MNKASLRKVYLEKRKQYTSEEVQWKSLQISMHFFSFFTLDTIQYLHIFLPISRQNEIDTWPIIQRISKNHSLVQIVIPKADLETFAMESYLYRPGMPLQTNKWGMSEPEDAPKVAPADIDMILMPLLVFDEKGFRVGYGKGYYDRYLQRCRKDVMKVGLSMEQPVQAITDIDHYDGKMDYCITPDKIWQFV